MYELAIIVATLISTVGFIVIVVLRNSATLQQLGVKMDYKQLEYDYKNKINKDRIGFQILKLQQQKELAKQGGSGILGNLANLDMDQIGDLLDKFGEISEGAAENPIMSALNNPVVKGFLQGLQKDKKEVNDLDQLPSGNDVY